MDFTMQDLRLQMPHCPITKQFFLALCTVKCGIKSDSEIEKNPQLLMLPFFDPIAKRSPFTSLGRIVESWLIQTPTYPDNSAQIF